MVMNEFNCYWSISLIIDNHYKWIRKLGSIETIENRVYKYNIYFIFGRHVFPNQISSPAYHNSCRVQVQWITSFSSNHNLLWLWRAYPTQSSAQFHALQSGQGAVRRTWLSVRLIVVRSVRHRGIHWWGQQPINLTFDPKAKGRGRKGQQQWL